MVPIANSQRDAEERKIIMHFLYNEMRTLNLIAALQNEQSWECFCDIVPQSSQHEGSFHFSLPIIDLFNVCIFLNAENTFFALGL